MVMPENMLNLSVEEYLDFELHSDGRHEFVDGAVYAMTGATEAHNIIVGNIFSLIRSHIKGSNCRVFANDMKVHIQDANCFYYPDIMMTCEPFDAKSVSKIAPSFICEVLSPSTSIVDLREKRQAYRQLNSLRQYAIVHQDHREVLLYQRVEARRWTVNTFRNTQEFILTAMPNHDLRVSLDAVYEDTDVK